MFESSIHGTLRIWKPATLALICGYVDSFTLSSFGVYSSFISGNTTKTGLQAGRGNFAEAGTTCSLFRYLSWGSLSERFLRTEPPAMNFGANCGSSQACWPPASSWCTSRRLRGCASRSSV